ncbi:cytochrome C [Bifidobacterium jacchi]|uniref:Cytochrome C n=1 Tax=Bifidobacterium jacchi TaxID=2490545 RepID=A0A5N5RCF3_9BIFI|nr:cytochrome C [Bifidobacterium jacchi]KAB5604154.1 cytochrome C [Bifidobacterium jacchi]
MGKVKITLKNSDLAGIGRRAADAYAAEHSHECAYCHKHIQPPADMPAGAVPVCDECAKARRLI